RPAVAVATAVPPPACNEQSRAISGLDLARPVARQAGFFIADAVHIAPTTGVVSSRLACLRGGKTPVGNPLPVALCSGRRRFPRLSCNRPARRRNDFSPTRFAAKAMRERTPMAKLNINGKVRDVQAEPDTPLLWV